MLGKVHLIKTNKNREQNYLKGTMSRQAHAPVGEKHFEIVGPTFSNTVGEFRKLFSSV